MKLKRDDIASCIKMCVYGAAGLGKTVLTASLPGRIRLISAEGGLLSLFGPLVTDSARERIDEIEISSFAEAVAEYNRLKTAYVDYDWIAIDSISELAELFLREAKAKEKDPRKAYGGVATEVGGLFRDLRDLPCNVYMTAKEIRVKDEATGIFSFEPDFPGGQLPKDVPYLYGEMFRIISDTSKERWLITDGDATQKAKDRSGRLEKKEPAHLGEIIRKITAPETET